MKSSQRTSVNSTKPLHLTPETKLPPPLDYLRDLFLDHSRIPEREISQSVTKEAQELLRSILEPTPHAR